MRAITGVCPSSEWRWESHQTCSGKYRTHVEMAKCSLLRKDYSVPSAGLQYVFSLHLTSITVRNCWLLQLKANGDQNMFFKKKEQLEAGKCFKCSVECPLIHIHSG